jgi:hypothetical protein
MGRGFGSSEAIFAPEPPLIARRNDLGTPDVVERLLAEIRQAFVLAGRAR